MQKYNHLPITMICFLGMTLFTYCHSEKSKNENIYIATSQLALRQSPSGQGKFLSDIMIGEQVTMLDSTFTDTEQKREYCKVELSDKKQGWALKGGLLPLVKLGVTKISLPLYKRPQVSTQLMDKSNMYQLIMFDTTQVTDSFIPITSMYGTPIGWIKQQDMKLNISTNIEDIFTVLHLVSRKLIKYTKDGIEVTDLGKLQTLHSELYEKQIESNILNLLLPSYNNDVTEPDEDDAEFDVDESSESDTPFVEEN